MGFMILLGTAFKDLLESNAYLFCSFAFFLQKVDMLAEQSDKVEKYSYF